MAITVVGSSSTQADESVILAKPAGTTQGDVIIVVVSTNRGIEPTGPAGFVAEISNDAPPLVGNWSVVFRKVAGASEPANYTFSNPGSSIVAGLTVYRGVNQAAPIDAKAATFRANGSPSTTQVTDSITTQKNNSMVIAAYRLFVRTTMVPAIGFEERYDQQHADAALTLMAADKVQAVAGATGSINGTSAVSSQSITVVLALAEAAVPEAVPVFLTLGLRRRRGQVILR